MPGNWGFPFLMQPLGLILFLVAIAWSVVWKGIALWRAARNGSLAWFIAILIVNTVGILEIVYIYAFSRRGKPAVEAKPGSPVAG